MQLSPIFCNNSKYNKKETDQTVSFLEVTTRFELVIRELQSLALPLGYVTVLNYDSDGNRTRVTAVKGRCLDRLTTEPCM